MSVNVSDRRFRHPGLLEEVAEALRTGGLPASSLPLETTESVAVEAGPAAIEALAVARPSASHSA